MRLNLRTLSYDCHIFSWIVEFFSASCTYPEICFFMDRQLFFSESGVAHIKPSFSSWSDGLLLRGAHHAVFFFMGRRAFCETHNDSSFSSWMSNGLFFARLVYSRLFLRGLAHLFYLVLSRLIAFFGFLFCATCFSLLRRSFDN